MAGRGIVSDEFPQPIGQIIPNAGYEYKAITHPDELVEIDISFGRDENTEDYCYYYTENEIGVDSLTLTIK